MKIKANKHGYRYDIDLEKQTIIVTKGFESEKKVCDFTRTNFYTSIMGKRCWNFQQALDRITGKLDDVQRKKALDIIVEWELLCI